MRFSFSKAKKIKLCLEKNEIFIFQSKAFPNKNESESFVRLAPYFTFVWPKFVFVERVHCMCIKYYNIIAKHTPVFVYGFLIFRSFSFLSYKLTNAKVGAKRTNSSLFSNEFPSLGGRSCTTDLNAVFYTTGS
jgi:hypothetical protein